MMIKTISIGILSLLFTTARSQTIYPDYEDGSIYFKLKDQTDLRFNPSQEMVSPNDLPFLDEIRKHYGIQEVRALFYRTNSDVLKKTIKITFPDYKAIDELINVLYQTGFIAYAEKVPLLSPAYDTNDPSFSKQWSLTKINANNAWNYSRGNKKTVVAVVDNAVDIRHPDLKANIWVNPNEIPGNGKDDDKDGYIDDINGWDAADNDNDPTPPQSSISHGTHTAGIIAAVSDNNIGISSLSFGISLMAVKTNKDSGGGSSSDIFKGITYAADAGADVISLSWSGTGSSQTDQNVMNYVYSKGAVMVAAAGNNNSETKTYPASYPNVISVASSDESDKRSVFSTYGTWVDITAPGSNIYSTVPGTGYQSMSGTSMACPLVASLCGLMLSLNPNLTQAQVENCLKSTCTFIDGINPGYAGKLGAGRINAEAAMKCVALLTGTGDEPTGENELTLYPNPAKGTFFIELNTGQNETIQVELLNGMGQKVLSFPIEITSGNYHKEMDISLFPQGIYFLHVRQNERYQVKRIVKL